MNRSGLLGTVLTLVGATALAMPPGATITIHAAPAPYILAAPHGDHDRHSGDMVGTLCAELGWRCLVARGLRTAARPLNVNRPTEGIGLPAARERPTERAASAYRHYRQAWLSLGGADALLYVELHGNARAASAGRLEVAVVGLDDTQVRRLGCLLDAALRDAGLDGLAAHVEGRDPLWFRARSSRMLGILAETPRALHLEVPRAWREPPRRQRLLGALRSALSTVAAMLRGEPAAGC